MYPKYMVSFETLSSVEIWLTYSMKQFPFQDRFTLNSSIYGIYIVHLQDN